MMIWWFTKYVGLGRLKRGLCPACSSSPPKKDCPVCLGTRDYGATMSSATRSLLSKRFDIWLKEKYK